MFGDLLWEEGKAKLAVMEEGKLGNMAAMAAMRDENSASGELFLSSVLELCSIEARSTEDWSICKGLFSLLLEDCCKGLNSPLAVCSSCKCFIIPWRRSFSLVSCSSSWLTICNWTRVCAWRNSILQCKYTISKLTYLMCTHRRLVVKGVMRR